MNLKKLKITCFDQSKLINAGKINKILLNKSKTLCENNLKIKSYIPVYINSENKRIDKINLEYFSEEKSKEINFYLFDYYQKYLEKNYIKSKERLILFFECLLCCNNIEKYNLELFGNGINIKLFQDMNWDIKQYEEINNKIYISDKYFIIKGIVDIYQNNYYKISELLLKIDNNNNKNKTDNSYYISIISHLYNLNNSLIKMLFSNSNSNSYKIRIYKKFIYKESLESAAIVHNLLTNEIRFMIKGYPEEIINKCNKFTLPNNIEEIISSYRKNGFIILVCASKLLNILEYDDMDNLEFYMNNLIFCGILILENIVKSSIKNSIKEIKKYNENIFIMSGDNEYNCLSVGFNCELFENKNIFILDSENNNRITINKILSKNYDKFKINETNKYNESESFIDITIENNYIFEEKNYRRKKNTYFISKR